MGIVSRLFRPKALQSWGPTDDRWYTPGGSFYGGDPVSSSGVPVSPETAVRLIAVQNCVRVRAATLALLPCHVFERQDSKNNKEATDFYLYDLLNDRPNSWMQSPIFWSMVEAFVCLRGNFIGYKLGIEGRPIQQIIPITDLVTDVVQNDDYTLTYKVRTKKLGMIDLPQSKVIHFRGLLTLNGITGANPIEYARETVGLGSAGTQFLGNYFSKGMHPGAVFEHPLALSAPAHADLKANLKKKYEGLGKVWEMMLIDEGMKVTFPQIKLVDAQYLELMKLNEAQICSLYRGICHSVRSGTV